MRAVPCECQDAARIQRLIDLSRLSANELKFRLADCWNVNTRTKAAALLEHNGWLTLVGPFGTGKSFLLKATVNEARLMGRVALYITMADLLQHFKESFNTETQTMNYTDLWKQVTTCSVLAIDEVDRYNPTPWAEEQLFRLANERYQYWQERATLWATNNFESVVGYLRDRMSDGRFRIIRLNAASVRPKLRGDK